MVKDKCGYPEVPVKKTAGLEKIDLEGWTDIASYWKRGSRKREKSIAKSGSILIG
jgi:hypothetical protein